jgi:hypothetical protein
MMATTSRRERALDKNPNRYWWISLVLVFGIAASFWYFQQRMFPASDGAPGAIVGFLMGAFLAALFEVYVDQSLG